MRLTMLHPSERGVPCRKCPALACWVDDDGATFCAEHRPYVMGERFEDDMHLVIEYDPERD